MSSLVLTVLDLLELMGKHIKVYLILHFLRHMPNLVIMMPKDENEGQHMVKTAIEYNDGPIALRYPRGNGLGVPLDETYIQFRLVHGKFYVKEQTLQS